MAIALRVRAENERHRPDHYPRGGPVTEPRPMTPEEVRFFAAAKWIIECPPEAWAAIVRVFGRPAARWEDVVFATRGTSRAESPTHAVAREVPADG